MSYLNPHTHQLDGDADAPGPRFEPATDGLIASLRSALADRERHDHPQGGDLFCLNLTSFTGERMRPVLALVDKQATEIAQLRAVADAVRGVIAAGQLAWDDDDPATAQGKAFTALHEAIQALDAGEGR